jgi:Tol biopolymer transport system component
MDADGGNVTRLTNNPGDDWGHTWMPDGNAISFLWGPADAGNLYLIDLDGTNQRLVDESLGPVTGDVAWSANGRQFLFTSARDGSGEDIYLFDLDMRLVSRITNSPGGSSSANAVWAKGGDYVLFTSNRAGLWDIYRMDPDGSDVRRLTETTEGFNGSWSLAQSPDGSELVFTSDRFGDSEVFLENMELFVVNIDGSNLRRLTTNHWMDGHPDW